MDDPQSDNSSEEERQNTIKDNNWHIAPGEEKIFWKNHILK